MLGVARFGKRRLSETPKCRNANSRGFFLNIECLGWGAQGEGVSLFTLTAKRGFRRLKLLRTCFRQPSRILGVSYYLLLLLCHILCPSLPATLKSLFSKSVGFRITPPCQLSAGWRQQSGPLPDSLVHWFIFSLTLTNPTNPLILTNPTTNPIIKTD